VSWKRKENYIEIASAIRTSSQVRYLKLYSVMEKKRKKDKKNDIESETHASAMRTSSQVTKIILCHMKKRKKKKCVVSDAPAAALRI